MNTIKRFILASVIMFIEIKKINAQNNSTLFQYKQYVPYDKGPTEINATQLVNYGSNLNYRDDNIQNSYNTTYGKAILYMKYACNHHKLTKPFLFVEGVSFDKKSIIEGVYNLKEYFQMFNGDSQESNNPLLEDVRNINGITTTSNTNPEVGYSTFNWATLVTGVDAEGVEQNEPLDVQKSPELLQKLYENGYDIVFVDFESGQRYMESNGYALSKALKAIKDSLDNNGSTEKIVVCGASMGGLVSRFAIRDLELNGGPTYDHCVGKFISFDSPQMGANISLAMQYMLNAIFKLRNIPLINNVDKIEEIIAAYTKLTCPSASQLMLYSCLSNPFNTVLPIEFIEAHESLERTIFNFHPNAVTWPINCGLYSIINGSRKGYAQNNGSHSNCDITVDVDGVVDIEIKSLPANNTGYCQLLNIHSNYPALVVPPFSFLASKRIMVRNSLGIDMVSGSFRRDLQQFTALNNKLFSALGEILFLNFAPLINGATYSAPNFCFIPAMSAAGIKNFTSLVENSHVALPQIFNDGHKLKDPNHTISHFDVVYAPEQNQTHVEITDENIAWVMQILNDCDDEIIKFQNEVIPSGTYTACNAIYAGNDVGVFNTCSYVSGYSQFIDPDVELDENGQPVIEYIPIYGTHCGPAIVQNGSNVAFKAQNIIDLQPGFEVEAGATFDAQIIGSTKITCPGTARYANNENTPQASITNTGIPISNSKGKNQKNKNYELPDYSINNPISNVNDEFRLIPNPANDKTTLIYSLELASQVTVEISNIYGQNVTKNISENEQSPGAHSVELDISKLSKGAYFVTLKSKNGNKSKQLLVN